MSDQSVDELLHEIAAMRRSHDRETERLKKDAEDSRLDLVRWRRWADNVLPPPLSPRNDEDARRAIGAALSRPTMTATITAKPGQAFEYSIGGPGEPTTFTAAGVTISTADQPVPIRRFEKRITFCGQPARVACDGNCAKAFGLMDRPRVMLGDADNPDDYAWLADSEVGIAPADPGTYEGDHAKPIGAVGPDDMNKWCVRACERCVMTEPGKTDDHLELREFSQRHYNMEPHHRGEVPNG